MLNAKILAAVTLAVLSGSVFASEVTEFPITPSVLSRAHVRAELAQARSQGTLPFGEAGHVFKIGPSTLSRAQVAAETRAAMRLGLIAVGDLNPRAATAQELDLIRVAGERATRATG
jgi:hypothetical protein